MYVRYSIVSGAVGFLIGVIYKERGSLASFNLLADNPLVPTIKDSEPMQVDNTDYVAKTMQFGFPGVDNICSRKSFILSYDQKNRVPKWVFEHLTREHVQYNENTSRSKCEFFEDSSIHPYFRSTNRDYKASGFDRGHLAAAGNHRCLQEYMADTFALTNIAPQVGQGFNRDAWNNLENHTRKLLKKYRSIYVCSGPLFLPRLESDGKKYIKYQVIGPQDVAVPTHFFKVIVGEREDNKFDMESYVMPNAKIDDNVPLQSFLVPVNTIERSAGFLLFEKLPKASLHRINGHQLKK